MEDFPLDYEPLSLDNLASPPVVRRGRAYARAGQVLDWAVAGSRLEARVQGLHQKPYLVAIEWDGEEFLPSCTCPFDAEPFCKHAIAALTVARGGPLARGPEADQGEWIPPEKPRRAEEIDIRRTRGRRTEEGGLRIRNLDGDRYYGSFEVESPSGRSYRVEIRSLRHLLNWCSCPDLSTNLLGTCKHIEAVLHRIRSRAPKKAERLAAEPPPRTHVLVRQGEEPRIQVQRGSRVSRRLEAFLDRWFDVTGAFRGDPAIDFETCRREARAFRNVVVGEDAVQFAEHAAGEESRRRRAAEAAERVLARGSRLPGVRAELYPYQTQGVAFLVGAGRAILGDDMGLGKTLEAIAACRLLRESDGVERALVVCPASLKHQWAREVERFTGERTVTISGGIVERKLQYRQRAPYTIVNYELVLRDGKRIRELDPDLLILDEAQRIKNWRTKTAEVIKAIRTRFAFVLTGTPLENRLDDIYSLMQVIDRRIFGPLWAFNERFIDLAPGGKRILGYRNLDRLREMIRPVFLRRERSVVLSQLPDRVDNRYYVPLTPTQREIMEEHMQKAAYYISLAEKRPLSPVEHKRLMAAFLRARMACNAAGLVDKETRGSPKLDEFARVLEEVCLESDRKAVIFSEWTQMLRMAIERASALGIEHLVLTGSVPTRKRGKLLDRFREDPGVKAFFSSDAGGLGLNLQAAQTVVNLDLPWNPARLEQRIARVHRMGQPRSVNVVLLIAENSMEQRIESVLAGKRELFRSVVGGAGEAAELSTRPHILAIMRAVVEGEAEDRAPAAPPAGAGDLAVAVAEPGAAALPETEAPSPPPGPAPSPGSPAPSGDGAAVLDRLREALGYRLLSVRRTRSGRLVVEVDRHDEEAERTVRDAAGERATVIDPPGLAALEAFGEDSPLAGAETWFDRSGETGAAPDSRSRELVRVARRRLAAARKLAEAGLGAEALAQAHGAMLTRLRAKLPPERDTEEPEALLRALYDLLLPAQEVTLEDAGTLSRLGDLARAFGSRDAPVPEPLVTGSLEEAARFVEG